MPQLIILLACVFALTSIGYARTNDRDRAARSFQNQMDNLQRSVNDDSQDNYSSDQNDQDDGNFANEDQSNQQNSSDNNGSNDGDSQSDHNDNGDNGQSNDHDGHASLEGDQGGALEKEVSELKQDMASTMLRLDRLERKLKAIDKKKIYHKQKITHHKQASHKKKKASKPGAKKAKHKKSED